MKQKRVVLVGFTAGVILTLPTILVALASGGAGHGDYIAAKVLFPLPMLLTTIEGWIGFLSAGVALMQFPLYGAFLGWAAHRRSIIVPALVLIVHFALVIVCLSGALPQFN